MHIGAKLTTAHAASFATAFGPTGASLGGATPSVLFSTRPRIAGMGDSRINLQGNVNPFSTPNGTLNTFPRGAFLLAEMLSGKFAGAAQAMWIDTADTVRHFSGANEGFSSQDSSWIITNALPKLLAKKPHAAFAQMGINDGGLSADQTAPGAGDTAALANFQTFYDQCRANVVTGGQGFTVPIIETVIPVAPSLAGTKVTPNALNKLLRDTFQNDPNCIFIDVAQTIIGSPYGYGPENLYVDGLHLNPAGSLIAAQAWKTAIEARIGASVANYYADTSVTNLLVNDFSGGTTGTKGTRVTGTVPTGWNVAQPSGTFFSTFVCSISTDATTGTQKLDIDVTPISGAAQGWEELIIRPVTASVTLGTAGAITGNNYALWAGVDIPDTDKIFGVFSKLTEVGTTSRVSVGHFYQATTEFLPSGNARRQWISTPALVMDASGTGVTPTFNIRFTTTGVDGVTSFRVSIVLPRLAQLTDQATLWS